MSAPPSRMRESGSSPSGIVATRTVDLPINLAKVQSYASQEFYSHALTYGAAQIDRTSSGPRQTARQAAIAASSNAW